jgi:hypothetical protein
VAECDRPAVDVEPLVLEAQLAHRGEHLRGEGLVELDQTIRASGSRLSSRARSSLV